MEIKNRDLVNIMSILEKYGNLKLPQRISYAITKNGMILSKDYNIYEAELKKIFSQYNKYMLKDSEGNIRCNSIGVPLVDEEHSVEFNDCISELLDIEIKVEFYYISDSLFEYDDNSGKYDALSAKDIIILQSILCKNED